MQTNKPYPWNRENAPNHLQNEKFEINLMSDFFFISVDGSSLQRDSAALESGCHSSVWETVEE